MKQYTLRYLPLVKQDLQEIIDYIQNTLKNPIAAEHTLSNIENAILERLKSPESFPVWNSAKVRDFPYRRINISNYTV